jgi:hypothetical protein
MLRNAGKPSNRRTYKSLGRQADRFAQEKDMTLEIWLPVFFVVGLVSMALCVAFLDGCAKI